MIAGKSKRGERDARVCERQRAFCISISEQQLVASVCLKLSRKQVVLCLLVQDSRVEKRERRFSSKTVFPSPNIISISS